MNAYCGTQNLIQLCIPQHTKSDTTLRHELLIESMWLRVVYDFVYHSIQNLIGLCILRYHSIQNLIQLYDMNCLLRDVA